MRYVTGYTPEGAKVWSENTPATDVQWGAHIGGRAIEERAPKKRGEPMSQNAIRTKARREGKLRGENLR